MKVEIKNRYSGAVIVTLDIDCDVGVSKSVQLGLAIRQAVALGADLYGADLTGADLRGADLRGANLRSAKLRSADLYGADLRGANLRSAKLRSADLYGADLYGADLRGANLYNTNLKLIFIRSDGYQHLFFWYSPNEILIQAGCRSFSNIERAREHWSNHARGPDCNLCLDSLDWLKMVDAKMERLNAKL